LPQVAEAIDGRCEVLLDGGVQCGQDVLRALALGARGCLIGKSFLYGLAALGGEGVTTALDLIRKELTVSLALTGCNNVQDVDRGILFDPSPPATLPRRAVKALS
jgi:L-lactate dehydrogenase (cytochrome)